jgi:geranylgeranyl pyrophosphate synthase
MSGNAAASSTDTNNNADDVASVTTSWFSRWLSSDHDQWNNVDTTPMEHDIAQVYRTIAAALDEIEQPDLRLSSQQVVSAATPSSEVPLRATLLMSRALHDIGSQHSLAETSPRHLRLAKIVHLIRLSADAIHTIEPISLMPMNGMWSAGDHSMNNGSITPLSLSASQYLISRASLALSYLDQPDISRLIARAMSHVVEGNLAHSYAAASQLPIHQQHRSSSSSSSDTKMSAGDRALDNYRRQAFLQTGSLLSHAFSAAALINTTHTFPRSHRQQTRHSLRPQSDGTIELSGQSDLFWTTAASVAPSAFESSTSASAYTLFTKSDTAYIAESFGKALGLAIHTAEDLRNYEKHGEMSLDSAPLVFAYANAPEKMAPLLERNDTKKVSKEVTSQWKRNRDALLLVLKKKKNSATDNGNGTKCWRR